MRFPLGLLIASVAVLSLPAGRLYSAEGEGTSGGVVARLPLGARSLGLGGAHGTIPADPEVLHVNPAALGRIEGVQMELAYHQGIEDLSYNGVVMAAPLMKWLSVGAGIGTLSAGEIEAHDYVGNAVQADLQEDRIVTAGLSLNFGSFSVGVSHKYMSSVLLGLVKSNVSMFDVGAGSKFDLGRNRQTWEGPSPDWLYVGASVSNIGDAFQYHTDALDSDPVPTLYRIGGAMARGLGGRRRVLTVLAVDVPRATARPEARGGVELRWPVAFIDAHLRGGAALRHDGGHFGAGAGVVIRGVSLDYAYLGPNGPFAATHHFSAGVNFLALGGKKAE